MKRQRYRTSRKTLQSVRQYLYLLYPRMGGRGLLGPIPAVKGQEEGTLDRSPAYCRIETSIQKLHVESVAAKSNVTGFPTRSALVCLSSSTVSLKEQDSSLYIFGDFYLKY